jgi:HK97 family phage portal protein
VHPGGLARRAPYATQSYNRVVWPSLLDGDATPPLVYDTATARRVPAFGRALALYGGMIKQCPLDDFVGIVAQPRPRLLEQPDPARGRPWFVQVSVEDYLEHGNAIALVTTRSPTGWPTSLAWLPAHWVVLKWSPDDPATLAYALVWNVERDLPVDDIVHVRRGADLYCPARGVGIVEEFCRTLDRVAQEEEFERRTMTGAAVPSVAVITPNARLGGDEAKVAGQEWWERYGGGGRRPAILPAGTQVIPLSFSPADAQLIEARRASLVDVANLCNLDSYWLGAPGSSHTYRSPGPLYLSLLRTSLEPVMVDFEAVWSAALLPRGHRVSMDRSVLLQDDLPTTIAALRNGVEGGLFTRDEARVPLRYPPLGDAVPQTGPLAAAGAAPDEAALADADSAHPAGGDDPAPTQEGATDA